MECVVCASEIPVTSKVCPCCGHVVKQAEVPTETESAIPAGVPLYTPKEKTAVRSTDKASVVVICVLSFLLVLSLIFCALGWLNYDSAKKEYEYWSDNFMELQARMSKIPNAENLEKFGEYKEKVKFYESHFCVINDMSNEYYHIYGCEDCNEEFEWAGYPRVAEGENYKPCPKCH